MTMLMLTALLLGSPASAQEVPVSEEAEATMAPSNRMEFDERLVRGETAAGAVVLFERKPRQLPALVPQRRSYRDRIVLPVLGPVSTQEPTE